MQERCAWQLAMFMMTRLSDCLLVLAQGGDCPWILRAEMDAAARSGQQDGLFHLREDLTCLEHSEACVQVCHRESLHCISYIMQIALLHSSPGNAALLVNVHLPTARFARRSLWTRPWLQAVLLEPRYWIHYRRSPSYQCCLPVRSVA